MYNYSGVWIYNGIHVYVCIYIYIIHTSTSTVCIRKLTRNSRCWHWRWSDEVPQDLVANGSQTGSAMGEFNHGICRKWWIYSHCVAIWGNFHSDESVDLLGYHIFWCHPSVANVHNSGVFLWDLQQEASSHSLKAWACRMRISDDTNSQRHEPSNGETDSMICMDPAHRLF